MANANGARRVVVTGMGVVTPIGLNVPDFWASMQASKCGVSELGGFPLEPQSVGAFYERLMNDLARLNLQVTISKKPNEVKRATR